MRRRRIEIQEVLEEAPEGHAREAPDKLEKELVGGERVEKPLKGIHERPLMSLKESIQG